MKNAFATIDTNDLDTVTGGAGAGTAIKKGAQWAWRNVAAPIASGAAWEGASRWLGGGSGQQPAQAPAQTGQ